MGSSNRGSVTAEFAIVLPAVILLLAVCLSAVQLSSRQLRLEDAASSAARAVARSEGPGAASNVVAELVPGAALAVDSRGELLCVTLRARGSALGGLFAAVPLVAEGCALGGGR